MLLFFMLFSHQALADVLLLNQNKTQKIMFQEFKKMNLHSDKGLSLKEAHAQLMKDLKKTKGFSMAKLQGNPASYFCEKAMNGENLTFYDLQENEYAICRLKNGVMVDAWELFRLKP